jgi:hypothetical protein
VNVEPLLPVFGSIPDQPTGVSDVISELARLSDMRTVPRVGDSSGWADLDPEEAWMVDIVKLGMCVQAILDMSPLNDEETLSLLARLVSRRVITCSFHPC